MQFCRFSAHLSNRLLSSAATVAQQWGASQTRASTPPVCPHSRSALEETAEWTATATPWLTSRPSPSLCVEASLTTGRSPKVRLSHRCSRSTVIENRGTEGTWNVCVCPYRAVPREDHLLPAVCRKPLHHRRPQLSRENWFQVRHSHLLE